MWLSAILGILSVAIAVATFVMYRYSFAEIPTISALFSSVALILGLAQISYVIYQTRFGVGAESKESLDVIEMLRRSIREYISSLKSLADAQQIRIDNGFPPAGSAD